MSLSLLYPASKEWRFVSPASGVALEMTLKVMSSDERLGKLSNMPGSPTELRRMASVERFVATKFKVACGLKLMSREARFGMLESGERSKIELPARFRVKRLDREARGAMEEIALL